MKYIAVDLGATNTVVAVVERREDAFIRILQKNSCPTNILAGAVGICKDIVNLSLKLLNDLNLNITDIEHIGLGVPGVVDPINAYVVYANNLDIKNWDIKSMLQDIYEKYLNISGLNISVSVENDANAAAYGEFVAGSLKGCKNAVAITLGTGVGCGIILNSEIYSGVNNMAGELGHMVIKKDGRACSCGRRGCLERYASATALVEFAKEAMQKEKNSLLWEISKNARDINGKIVFDAARKNDKTACSVLESYFSYLACGLINIINLLQPEKICIGGGISNQGDILISALEKYIFKEIYSRDYAKNTEICIAKLGNDAGLIGAALINRSK